MQVQEGLYRPVSCKHDCTTGHKGNLALVTIGNKLRADDGIAQHVMENLPCSLLDRICCFDLGSYSYFLIDCLAGHKAGIVVDSTKSGNPPGSLTVLDLSPVVGSQSPLKLHFSHGMSLLDELRVGCWRGLLPEKTLFVGIEAGSSDWSCRLSWQLSARLSELTAEISKLIELTLQEIAGNA